MGLRAIEAIIVVRIVIESEIGSDRLLVDEPANVIFDQFRLDRPHEV